MVCKLDTRRTLELKPHVNLTPWEAWNSCWKKICNSWKFTMTSTCPPWRVHSYAWAHTCKHIPHTCIHATHTHTHLHAYTMGSCMHTHAHKFSHTCAHICIHTHTHTLSVLRSFSFRILRYQWELGTGNIKSLPIHHNPTLLFLKFLFI